jgi:RNA polymerase sigma factor (sigma-70 family)
MTRPESSTSSTRESDAAYWAEDVLRALAALDPVEEQYLRLSYWHGQTHDVIADQVDLPRAHVSAIIATAMRRLAATLRTQPDDV